MTNTANSFLGDSDVSGTCATTLDAITNSQLRLDLHIPCLAKIGDNASFVEHGVRGAHAALEVEFKFLHGLLVRDEFEGRVGWESGAVLGEEVDSGVILRRVAVRWAEVKGEEREVDCVFFFSFLGEVNMVAISC
jgi:hypothetical protein